MMGNEKECVERFKKRIEDLESCFNRSCGGNTHVITILSEDIPRLPSCLFFYICNQFIEKSVEKANTFQRFFRINFINKFRQQSTPSTPTTLQNHGCFKINKPEN